MAGGRKRVGGPKDEEPAGLEIIGADESASEVAVAGGRQLDWHTVLRTGAAVVAALGLLWTGWSSAERAAAEGQQACLVDVERAYWRYEQQPFARDDGSALNDEVVDDLVATARDCGARAFADALDRTRPTDD